MKIGQDYNCTLSHRKSVNELPLPTHGKISDNVMSDGIFQEMKRKRNNN